MLLNFVIYALSRVGFLLPLTNRVLGGGVIRVFSSSTSFLGFDSFVSFGAFSSLSPLDNDKGCFSLGFIGCCSRGSGCFLTRVFEGSEVKVRVFPRISLLGTCKVELLLQSEALNLN